MNNWPEMMVKRVAASYCGLSVETFERGMAQAAIIKLENKRGTRKQDGKRA